MGELNAKLAEFARLIDELACREGSNATVLDRLFTFRCSTPHERKSLIYEPMLVFAAQGHKRLYLEDRQFEYGAGQFMALFVPMAFECELHGVSPEQPMLGMAIRLDRQRITELLSRLPQASDQQNLASTHSQSGVLSAAIDGKLLDAAIRLLQTAAEPIEASVLGDAIIDEIYYRAICGRHGCALGALLQHQGQIGQIARAVELLHDNLERSVPIEELAAEVNMSTSGFHKKFKQVMHVSPLQYTKLVRLNRARALLLDGHSVSDAGFRVGYNSSAQFSREYKRQFGSVPSAALEQAI
jgi:AraC-like DNA-binding protein